MQGQTNIRKEVYIRPYLDDKGTLADYKVRVDFVGRQSSALRLSEAKAGQNGGFTDNQRVGYPLIEKFGGEFAGGRGGGAVYPKGTVIPPTKIDVYRPGPGNTVVRGGI